MRKFKKWFRRKFVYDSFHRVIIGDRNGKLFLIGFMIQYLHCRFKQEGIKFGMPLDYDIAYLDCNAIYDDLKNKIIRIDMGNHYTHIKKNNISLSIIPGVEGGEKNE